MEFTIEEKKKLNEFLDKYEDLLEEGDYVTFLKEYRDQNRRDALYYAFVDLIKKTFNLNLEWFIKNDPHFYWFNYVYEDTGITHINIPDSVTSIGYSAFENCDNLTTVTFGENSQLTTIGSHAFYNCYSLISITIPDSVTSIGNYAFEDCSSLTSIIIPDSVTTIGEGAFAFCSNLTIYCEATSKPRGWDSWWNYSNCPVVWGYKKK